MKKKVYSIVFLLVLVLFLIAGIMSSRHDYISVENEEVPLASGASKAYFFMLNDNKNISFSSLIRAKYIGIGQVINPKKSSNISEIQNMIISIPACSRYLDENQRMEWVRVNVFLGKCCVYGYPVDIQTEEDTNIGDDIPDLDDSENKSDEVIKVSYSNVSDMVKDNSLSAGMEVQTKGYYVEGIGAGTYTISDEEKEANGGTILALENGMFACLKIDNQTIDVTQFGAYADGIHNDSKAIENALNSGISTVTFFKGSYKCCNFIKMTHGDVSVIGNDSILFTDNDYQSEYYEWFFNIVASNIVIDGLHFEARETITPNRKSQMGIMYASNITIKNCEFNIPNTVLTDAPDKNCEYTNLDIYTSWENVTIDNCTFYDMADCLAGGCLEIRDIKGYDCSGCTFINNTCYANNHDEIIGVFCLSDYNRISDVTIKGNSFHQENTTMYGRAVGLSLGYSGTYGAGANNVVFENNYFEGYCHYEFIKFGMSENVSIKSNTMICHLDGTQYTDLCLFRCADANNVSFVDNTIDIKKDEYDQMTAISRGNVLFDNNTIRSEIKFGNILFQGVSGFTNNSLTFDEAFSKTIVQSSYDGVEIENNEIWANAWQADVFNFAKIDNVDVNQDLYVNNNTFHLHNKSIFSAILLCSDLTMNDSVLHCNNNTVIDEDEGNAIVAYLYNVTFSNEDIDKIECTNNNSGALSRMQINTK